MQPDVHPMARVPQPGQPTQSLPHAPQPHPYQQQPPQQPQQPQPQQPIVAARPTGPAALALRPVRKKFFSKTCRWIGFQFLKARHYKVGKKVWIKRRYEWEKNTM